MVPVFQAVRIMIIALLAGLILTILHPAAVSAEAAIQVTPAHLSLAMAAGDSTTETVTVRNLSNSPVTVKGNSAASAAQPAVTLDPDQVELAPDASATIRIGIQVRPETEPGNTHAAVGLVAVPGDSNEVAVIGQVEVGIDIEVFHPVDDVQWSWPRLIDSGDRAAFSVRGRNAGKAPARLTATINMRGLPFGGGELKMVSQDLAVGQEGEMETVWDDRPLFGLEWTTLTVSAGPGAPVEQKTLIIVFPWKLALAFACVTLTGAGGIFMARRSRRPLP